MKKKLYRDAANAKLAGVCSGVAEYFGVDVTVVRVLWSLITLAGGSGIIAYIICVVLIPEKPPYVEVDYQNVD